MKNIGDRMKHNYENRYRYKLLRRTPVIMRFDGRSFHSFTRHFHKPFDENLSKIMHNVMKDLLQEIQGAKLGYQQSDEISIFITDFDDLQTEAWFDYNVQKMCSIGAAYCSCMFNKHYNNPNKIALFDARCFNIPKEEVNNYFIWRQKDWIRNSLQMLSRANFSHKQLHGKNTKDMHDMLHSIGINWADLEYKWKNGITIYKNSDGITTDSSIIFTQNSVVSSYLYQEE